MENIKEIAVEPAMAATEKASITCIRVVELDEQKKQKGEQRCEISGKKSRYLFGLTNTEKDTRFVSAGVLRNQLGLDQHRVDKLYSIAYYSAPTGATGVPEQVKAERLASFLGGEQPEAEAEEPVLVEANAEPIDEENFFVDAE